VEDLGRLSGGVVEPPSFDGEIWSAVRLRQEGVGDLTFPGVGAS
jgi:hypothetical protein